MVLIGAPGVGKSTVGAILARAIGLVHHDVDALLEARVGPLPAFAAARGVEAFRSAEREVVAELAALGPAVISAGAGTVLHRRTRALLCQGARVFFLDAPPAIIAARLHGLPASARHRPDLVGPTVADTAAAVARILAERGPLYARLGERVDAAGGAEQVAATIRGLLAR